MTITPELQKHIDAYIAKLNDRAKHRLTQNYIPCRVNYSAPKPFKLAKYARIVISLGDDQSYVYGFIGEDGSIYKAASWARPELNSARGSVYDADPLQHSTIYGFKRLAR